MIFFREKIKLLKERKLGQIRKQGKNNNNNESRRMQLKHFIML